MKKFTLTLAGMFCFAVMSIAQVKIGGSGNPDANAVLELDGGTNRGLLMPRLSAAQMNAMVAPDGMMIYNTSYASLFVGKAGVWTRVTDGFTFPYAGQHHIVQTSLLDLYNAATGPGVAVISGKASTGTGVKGTTGQGIGVEGAATSGTAAYFSASDGFPAIQTGTGSVIIGTSSTTKGKLVVKGSWGSVAAMFGETLQGISLEVGDAAVAFNSYRIGTRKAMANGHGGYITLSPVTGNFSIFTSSLPGTADNDIAVTQRMTITKDGYVGINKPNPSSALDVSGKATFVKTAGDDAAIEVDGPIKVSGSNPTAFIRTVIANENGAKSLIINTPVCNNDPDAMLFVTAQNDTPVFVSFDANINKWRVSTTSAPEHFFVNGEKFNILVIKSN